MKKIMGALAGLGFAGGAYAYPPVNEVDVFYVADSDFELDDSFEALEFSSDGGWGVRGSFHFTEQAFVGAEYQSVDYDEVEIEGQGSGEVDVTIEDIRAGVGFYFLPDLPFYGQAEFATIEVEVEGESEDDSGYGLHLGARNRLPGGFGYYAQIGYVDVGDAGNGVEFLVGGSFNFTPQFGAFLDYRRTELDADDNEEVSLGDFRVGVHFFF